MKKYGGNSPDTYVASRGKALKKSRTLGRKNQE